MSASDPPDVDRLRAALARLGDEPDWPEVDAERLFSALHGDMSAEERRAVVDELARNPRAAAAWRLARELEPEKPARIEGRSQMWTWMPIAATLLLMAGVAWQWQPWRSEAPVYRSAEPRSIASLLPAGARLSREQPVLRWTAVEGARYRVRVLTPDLELVDEADDLAAPEYRLNPDVLRVIPAGGRILWQVEARVTGTAAVVSPTFSVQME
jgi:hypothetical protein